MASRHSLVVVLTGSTSGIGLEIARSLAGQGHRLILPMRPSAQADNTERELRKDFPTVSIDRIDCDLKDLSQVKSLSQRIARRTPKLDILINNAGVMKSKRELTPEGFEVNWVVNCLAPWLLSRELLPLLNQADEPRIVQVSSEGHRQALLSSKPARIDWTNLQGETDYKIFAAYSQSKLAFLLLSYELDRQIQQNVDAGVVSVRPTVNNVHPGVIKTDLGRELPRAITMPYHLMSGSPSKGAAAVIHVATAPALKGRSGLYFDQTNETKSSPESYDEEVARRLWSVCSEQTKNVTWTAGEHVSSGVVASL